VVADDQAPPLDPAIDAALTEFASKKKASMPDAFA
jgi:trimethylamine:corrinoid methyltransferase-like protein